MENAIDRKKKYAPGSREPNELNHLLMEWIASEALPYRIVSSERLAAFFNRPNGHYELPSEKYLRTTLMPSSHEKVRSAMFELLKEKLEWISCATDSWTSQNMQSYVSLTGHFITSSWQRKTVILVSFTNFAFNDSIIYTLISTGMFSLR